MASSVRESGIGISIIPWIFCVVGGVYLLRMVTKPIEVVVPTVAVSQAPVQPKAARPFTLATDQALFLKVPANGKEYEDGSASGIMFSWNKVAAEDARMIDYRWELAADQRFTKKIRSVTTNQTTVSGPAISLPPGRYYWRVSVLGDGKAPVLTSDTFTLVVNSTPVLLPPTSKVKLQEERRK